MVMPCHITSGVARLSQSAEGGNLPAQNLFASFQVIRVPTRTNQIPRQVPPQACYTRTLPAMLLTGLLPFGCIFVQLFFIFNSIWGQQLFFMFGFLFLVFVFFLACIIEITILTCYFQLCAEVSYCGEVCLLSVCLSVPLKTVWHKRLEVAFP